MSDSSHPGGLEPERYGELLAHVLHFENDQRREVLSRLGQDADAFEEAHRAWQEALIAEAMKEENALAVSYAVPFSATKKRLKEERPTLESLGALPTEAAAEDTPAATKGGGTERPAGQETSTPVELRSGASVGQILTGTDNVDASPTPPPAEASEPAAAEPIDSTMTGDLPANFLAAAALPFVEGQRDAESPEAGKLRKETTEKLHVDDVTAPSATGTELAFRSPFAGMALPWEEPTPTPTPGGYETVALDAEAMQRALATHDPESRSGSLTLEQYASFVVECRVYRDRLPSIYARYGVANAEAASALDAHFGRRFSEDPALRKRFLSLEAEYFQWLQENRPR